ncbi:MAG: type II toxin-antitoxin system VapC family toxin [Treponema sp.]|jgi:PIN domain nuclease of toxin-antitoxin system|nr:type II toxin-antitoxin system VapC family toxin [Treponema sp.]
MDYLVDTQSFIWFVEDDERLPQRIKAVMEQDDARLLVSIASLWEMTIKVSLGKLLLSGTLETIFDRLEQNGFDVLPTGTEHLITLSTLALTHRDPFDRIIIAQAISADIPVISSDDVFAMYPVKRVWM